MYWLLSLLLLGTPLISGAFPQLAAPTAPAPLDQCRLWVRLDPRTGTVQAHGTWHVQAGRLPATLHFLLAPGLVAQTVQGSRILGFSQRPGTRSGDTLTLHLRPSGQHVAPLRFHLAYAGRVAASPLPQAIHAWSASWLELTERLGLMPLRCPVPLTQRTTYTLHVELPPGYDLVGSGRIRRPCAGHWTLHQRATRQLGLFGAPGLARWRAPSPRGLAVWVVQPGAVDTIAQHLATLAGRAATFYNAQYGARRLRQLCLVVPPPSAQLPGQTWSYALPGPGSGSVEPGATAEQTFYTIGHEVAHHWWHASPYPNSQYQSYLNEGFAEYACLSFYRATYGEAAFAALLARYRAIAETLPPCLRWPRICPLKPAISLFTSNRPTPCGCWKRTWAGRRCASCCVRPCGSSPPRTPPGSPLWNAQLAYQPESFSKPISNVTLSRTSGSTNLDGVKKLLEQKGESRCPS